MNNIVSSLFIPKKSTLKHKFKKEVQEKENNEPMKMTYEIKMRIRTFSFTSACSSTWLPTFPTPK
jgi:hypothetical protein